MKKIIFFGAFLVLSACGQAENSDQNFDNFYQGSPPEQKIDAENSTDTNTNDINVEDSTTAEKSFTIKGENENYSCEFVCTEK